MALSAVLFHSPHPLTGFFSSPTLKLSTRRTLKKARKKGSLLICDNSINATTELAELQDKKRKNPLAL